VYFSGIQVFDSGLAGDAFKDVVGFPEASGSFLLSRRRLYTTVKKHHL
jgi:hypothetical protein